MPDGENRQISRDSLFLMAEIRVDGSDATCRIKVRNLSAGGMMGEGQVRVVRGDMVHIAIRNLGWVEGSIAWVQDTRFGVAFREDIDPKLARAPVGTAEDPAPAYVRNHQAHFGQPTELRKI